jgi:hypothetical protein
MALKRRLGEAVDSQSSLFDPPSRLNPPSRLDPDRHVPSETTSARARPVRRRVGRHLAVAVMPILLAAATVLAVPVPFLDSYLTRMVAAKIAERTACPGSTAPAPRVTLGGGRILPQLLNRRLSEIRLTTSDTTIGGVAHADFEATLRGVTPLTADAAKAESIDASITLGFKDLPPPPDGPAPTFGRTEDGGLTVTVASSPEQAKNVVATAFLKMDLQGETITAIPQRIRLFGRMVEASKIRSLAGGPRKQKLPALPAGLHYTAITPKPTGLHVTLGGVVNTPLSALPSEVDGRRVSYVARSGRLGISTSFAIPPIVDVPLTIFTEPRLRDGTLTLVPRSVQVLGADRPPNDLIARLVLDQIDQAALTRRLPALPNGVTYRSVSVDEAGVKVAVGGVTVRPFTDLPPLGDGPKPAFGAENGLLTATTRGASTAGGATQVVLFAEPKIVDNVLDLTPREIEMFGTLFPADAVFAQIDAPATSYPLQALPTGLAYTGVTVLDGGLRIAVSGKDLDLSPGALGGGCTTD